MTRAPHARGPTRILRDAARNGQDLLAPTKTDTVPPARAPILRYPAAVAPTPAPAQDREDDAGSPPLIAVIGAIHEVQHAARAAHAIRSRLEYLAEAPAAQLATPYQVRRAARDMLRDAALLCGCLDALATREGIAHILRARTRAPHQAPSRSGEGRGDAS